MAVVRAQSICEKVDLFLAVADKDGDG